MEVNIFIDSKGNLKEIEEEKVKELDWLDSCFISYDKLEILRNLFNIESYELNEKIDRDSNCGSRSISQDGLSLNLYSTDDDYTGDTYRTALELSKLEKFDLPKVNDKIDTTAIKFGKRWELFPPIHYYKLFNALDYYFYINYKYDYIIVVSDDLVIATGLKKDMADIIDDLIIADLDSCERLLFKDEASGQLIDYNSINYRYRITKIEHLDDKLVSYIRRLKK